MKNGNKHNALIEWILGLGVLGIIFAWLVSIVIGISTFQVWLDGVIYGFHHSILLGFVSLIPVVGFFEGLMHLLHII